MLHACRSLPVVAAVQEQDLGDVLLGYQLPYALGGSSQLKEACGKGVEKLI